MKTDLAIAVAVDWPACVVRKLGTKAPIDATLSNVMVEHFIRVRTGDLVDMNFSAEPPQVVYRWWRSTVVAVEDQGITITRVPTRGDPSSRASGVILPGLGIELAIGDTVFLDTSGQGRYVVVDIAAEAEPVHPERFTEQYPRIRDEIRNMDAAETANDVSFEGELFAEQIPEPLARAGKLMSTFHPDWSLCGGWAVDAWLGRQTRDHVDVDISVFQVDQRALFDHLAGWQLIAHDPNVAGDTTEPWNRRRLDLPAHIHVTAKEASVDPTSGQAAGVFNLDVQLNERAGRHWIFSREPHITLPLRKSVRSVYGLPTLVPEVLLFYKAKGWGLRPHDEFDFLALHPHLTESQRCWLAEAISLIHPDHHPWLTQLSL